MEIEIYQHNSNIENYEPIIIDIETKDNKEDNTEINGPNPDESDNELSYLQKTYTHKSITNDDIIYFLTCTNFDQLFEYLLTFTSDISVSYLIEAFTQINDKNNELNSLYYKAKIKDSYSIFLNDKFLDWDDYIGEFYINLFCYTNPKHLQFGTGDAKTLRGRNKDIINSILTSITHLKKKKLYNLTQRTKEFAIKSWDVVDYPYLQLFIHTFYIRDEIKKANLVFELNNYAKRKDIKLILILISIFKVKHGEIISFYELIENIIVFEKDNSLEPIQKLLRPSSSLTEHKKLLIHTIDMLVFYRLEKIAARLIQFYKLSPDDYPQISSGLLMGTSNYFYNEFSKGLMTIQNLGELFCKYPNCLINICNKLQRNKFNKEALYLIEKYNLNNLSNKQLNSMYNQLKKSKITKFIEKEDIFGPTDNECLSISKLYNNVKFINGENELLLIEFYSSLANSKILSLDSEWSPISTIFIKAQVNILQICTDKLEIYLLDIPVLNKNPAFNENMKKYFEDPSIIKIGFSFKNDIVMFKQANLTFFDNMKGFKEITDMFIKSKYWKDQMKMSLNEVFKSIFNVGICKSEQMSNWELRPLRKSQQHYASVDVYVLIMIYNKIV